MTPRDYAALTPLIWSHVNPYGRFDLDMNARMALACRIWRLMTRVLALPLVVQIEKQPPYAPACGAPPAPWAQPLSSVQSLSLFREGESSSSLPRSRDSRSWLSNYDAPLPSLPRSSLGHYRVRQCAF